LHKTNPGLSSHTLEISFYDDYESSLHLEPNFMVHTPLTGLEKEIDLILIPLPFVALSLSSTPRDTTIGDLTLLAFSLPLAQCTVLEMDESYKGDASFVNDDLLD